MSQKLRCAILSALLTGSLTYPANSQAVDQKRFELMAKECAGRIAKERPDHKIVGRFSLFSTSNIIASMVAKMIIHPGDIIVLAAPSESPYMFLTHKGYTGCAFGVTNGSVSFKRIMIPNNFPARYK